MRFSLCGRTEVKVLSPLEWKGTFPVLGVWAAPRTIFTALIKSFPRFLKKDSLPVGPGKSLNLIFSLF